MTWWDPDYVEPSEDLRPFRVDRALSTLTAKQRLVIEYRFGIADGQCYSLAYIARHLGTSKQAVWKLEQAALERLQQFRWVDVSSPS